MVLTLPIMLAAAACGSGSDGAVPASSAPTTEQATTTTEATVPVTAPMTEWTIHAPAYGDEGIRWGDLRDTLTPVEVSVGTVWISGETNFGYMERDCSGMKAADLEEFTGLRVSYLICVPDL